jgi:hypothetical protein
MSQANRLKLQTIAFVVLATWRGHPDSHQRARVAFLHGSVRGPGVEQLDSDSPSAGAREGQ